MDYQNISEAHEKYRQNMLKLNKAIKAEQVAEAEYLDKENQVRKELFTKLAGGEITKGLYDESIKNECFAEKVEWKKCVTARKLSENEAEGAKENLNVVKRMHDETN